MKRKNQKRPRKNRKYNVVNWRYLALGVAFLLSTYFVGQILNNYKAGAQIATLMTYVKGYIWRKK